LGVICQRAIRAVRPILTSESASESGCIAAVTCHPALSRFERQLRDANSHFHTLEIPFIDNLRHDEHVDATTYSGVLGDA
jgi:hypothetical protein